MVCNFSLCEDEGFGVDSGTSGGPVPLLGAPPLGPPGPAPGGLLRPARVALGSFRTLPPLQAAPCHQGPGGGRLVSDSLSAVTQGFPGPDILLSTYGVWLPGTPVRDHEISSPAGHVGRGVGGGRKDSPSQSCPFSCGWQYQYLPVSCPTPVQGENHTAWLSESTQWTGKGVWGQIWVCHFFAVCSWEAQSPFWASGLETPGKAASREVPG